MPKVQTISTTAPSGAPILCCHCKRTMSPLPVCGPCQRAYIAKRVRLSPGLVETVVSKIAAQTVGGKQ